MRSFFESSHGLDVLAALIRARECLDKCEEPPKIGIFCSSGTMAGAIGAGWTEALEEHRLTNVFSHAIGSSAGAPDLAYFLAWQSRIGASIYHRDCIGAGKFLDMKRGFAGGGFFDPRYLGRVFRGEIGVKRLDTDAVRASRTEFLVTATRTSDMGGVLLDAKHGDTVQKLCASLSMPGLSPTSEIIDGEEYVDGSVAWPLLPRSVIERTGVEYVLFLMNLPPPEQATDSNQAALLSYIPTRYHKALEAAPKLFHRDLAWLREQNNVKAAFLWQDGSIGPFERHARRLVQATDDARNDLNSLLDAAENSARLST